MNILWILCALFCVSVLWYYIIHQSTKKLFIIVYLKLRSLKRCTKPNLIHMKKNDDDMYSDDVYSDEENIPPSL